MYSTDGTRRSRHRLKLFNEFNLACILQGGPLPTNTQLSMIAARALCEEGELDVSAAELDYARSACQAWIENKDDAREDLRKHYAGEPLGHKQQNDADDSSSSSRDSDENEVVEEQ
jgi:hypothetical protein